jgi:hypothetical protein
MFILNLCFVNNTTNSIILNGNWFIFSNNNKRFCHISAHQKLLYPMVAILDVGLERNKEYFFRTNSSFWLAEIWLNKLLSLKTTGPLEMKLYRNDLWMVLKKYSLFRSNPTSNMATTIYPIFSIHHNSRPFYFSPTFKFAFKTLRVGKLLDYS